MSMKENNNQYMAWNAPGSNGGSSGNNKPRNEESPNNNNNDPWGRADRGGSSDNNPWGKRSKSNDGFDFNKFANTFFKKKGNQGGNGGFGNKTPSKIRPSFGVSVILAALVGIYAFTGFYTVREAERGVLLRFGKFAEVIEPGLHWKFSGIENVTVVDVEQVRSIQSSGSMLTEDENVVLVEMDVQYRVSDPTAFLYSTTDPINSLTEATDSALRYVVGHTMMDDILTSGREMVRQNTKDLLISIIEPYNTGLSVVDVNFLPARAPDQVKEAFDDAIAAQEDEQRFKREAEAYANEVLPKADGQVRRILEEAEAYRSQVVLDAEGAVARFNQVLPEYLRAPEITRTRIYLETMQEVLSKNPKVILDTKDGTSPVLYLPIDKMQSRVQEVSKQINETVGVNSTPTTTTTTQTQEYEVLPNSNMQQTRTTERVDNRYGTYSRGGR